MAPAILDTSVIIDGRIADIYRTGFIESQLILPNFVLDELKRVADSSDPMKKSRGRRGMDILNELQKDYPKAITMVNKDYEEIKEVDIKIIRLAVDMKAVSYTHLDVYKRQVLDDGRLTDSMGRTVDFRNAIIIMTSNVGAQNVYGGNKNMGFLAEESSDNYEDIKERYLADLKNTFRPEFINRVDDIIVFHPLNEEDIVAIADLMLNELRHRLADQHIELEAVSYTHLHTVNYFKVNQGRDIIISPVGGR